MRKAEGTLLAMRKLGQKGIPLTRVYRNLFDVDLFLGAYNKLYRNDGAMTPGTTTETVDGMNLQRIERIIDLLRAERYHFNPTRRIYVPKADGRRRPISMPSFSDKLVQEVVRAVLEAYYEPQFSNLSHGFRPNRGCHTALTELYYSFGGVKWFIEGDIKGCFDNIDHATLLHIVGKRIRDFRFHKLLKTMLEAGYCEFGQRHRTFAGTPQGGVVSPILANIFLHELDEYVVNLLKPAFDKGKRRRPNPEYQRLSTRITTAKRKGDGAKVAALRKERKQITAGDPYDPNYRRLVYIRYADDFLIGIIGSKADCRAVKELGSVDIST